MNEYERCIQDRWEWQDRLDRRKDRPAPATNDGIIFGTDIFTGEVLTRKLPEITHMLVAGTTGFGKSVFLHQLTNQFIECADVKQLFLVDFKGGVEFWRYQERDPKVRVVWEVSDLAFMVGKLLELMQTRQAKMRERRLRDWPGPRVIVIIDEYSEIQWCDANKQTRGQLLDGLNRLVARSRSAGVVIIAATQKPTTDAMDSAFSANLPTRVCFKVASNLVASMVLGTLEDLRREPGLDPATLRKGWCIVRDGWSGEARYVQPHMAADLGTPA